MASGIGRTIRQAILDHLLKTGTWTAPADIYVALYTAAPTATGGGTELSSAGGSGYARIKHNAWNASTAAEPSVATNDGAITFPVAGTSWGAIVAFGLFDALTSGNFLAYGVCSKTISVGDIAYFADQQLQITLNES